MSHAAPPPSRSGGTGSLRLRHNRWRGLTVALAGGALLLVTGSWWATHPADLPVRDGHVTAVTTPGRPVYIGVYSGAADGRLLRLGGVHVRTDATVPVEVEATRQAQKAYEKLSKTAASNFRHRIGPADSVAGLERLAG